MHHYVLPVADDERRAPLIRQQQDKLFYVSPFIADAMRYHFRISPPSETVRIRILETDREGPVLAATFNGKRRALTGRALIARRGAATACHIQNYRRNPLASLASLD